MLKCAEVRSDIRRNNQECSGAYDFGVLPIGFREDSCNGFAFFISNLCKLRAFFHFFAMKSFFCVGTWSSTPPMETEEDGDDKDKKPEVVEIHENNQLFRK